MTDTVRARLDESPEQRYGTAITRGRSLIGWIACGVLGVAFVWIGAAAGLWFFPFVAGVLAGVTARISRCRSGAPVTAGGLIALGGWGLPLLWQALRGEPVGATARVVAALAGLPPYAAVVVAATILVAVLQAAAGVWLGLAVAGLVPGRFRPGR